MAVSQYLGILVGVCPYSGRDAADELSGDLVQI